jgi:hypothetical protein
MVRKFFHFGMLLLIAAGCSPVSGTAPNRSVSSSSQDTPDHAVFEFLEAVRTGNDKQAEDMLTPVARQKTTEMQMVVAPPGSPTAKFTIGGVEYVTPEKDGAHVWCTWTDVADDQGHTRSDDIIWVLRHEAEGWRIAGMVTKVYPDKPPLILNFEDPEDMLRKQQLLHGEAAGGGDSEQPAGEPQATRAEQVPPVAR